MDADQLYKINVTNQNNRTRIASFDIGIKNMALCIFDISGENISICYWDVLNLIKVETHNEIYKCNCSLIVKKNGPIKTCGKNAKYKKLDNLFCEKHAKMSKYMLPKKELSCVSLKKKKMEELLSISQEYSISLGEHKLKKDILLAINGFFDNKCLELISVNKKKTASEIDLITIGRNMRNELDNLDNIQINTITHVIIENQISPIANRMKTIQGMLAQYFIIEGDANLKIDFVSSSNKLRGLNVASKDDNQENKNDYKQRKENGIFHCEQFLDCNHSFHPYKDILNQRKKADDLADCFLQGIWYIKKYTSSL